MDPNTPWKCCICGGYFRGWGNNPDPIPANKDARCCDICNMTTVIPARIALRNEIRERSRDEAGTGSGKSVKRDV